MDSADLLTLDWRSSDSNKIEMLYRLAPNLRSQGLSATPDFGIASYFTDTAILPNGGNGAGRTGPESQISSAEPACGKPMRCTP